MVSYPFDTDILIRAIVMFLKEGKTDEFKPLKKRSKEDILEFKASKKFFDMEGIDRVLLYSVKDEFNNKYRPKILKFCRQMYKYRDTDKKLKDIILEVKKLKGLEGVAEAFLNFSRGNWKEELESFRALFLINSIILQQKAREFEKPEERIYRTCFDKITKELKFFNRPRLSQDKENLVACACLKKKEKSNVVFVVIDKMFYKHQEQLECVVNCSLQLPSEVIGQ